MGVILHKKLSGSCSLGIWSIDEEYDELLSNLVLNPREQLTLDSFRNPERKLEWLSVRTLMNAMAGKRVRIVYNADRKPYLEDKSHNISISHSNKLTAIIMSKEMRVGIDMEYMSHRISKIGDRFIHESEKITDDPELIKYHLYIHWCAKEALYKICDKQGIHFKKDIIIDCFDPATEGKLTGLVKSDAGSERFDLNYFRLDNYIIVWSCK
jgi:4'-phosphopantetheinyl transferase